jgi:hypothetical protein
MSLERVERVELVERLEGVDMLSERSEELQLRQDNEPVTEDVFIRWLKVILRKMWGK